jgi:hypothetical protein
MELTATTVLLFSGSMIFLTVNFVAGNGLSLLVKGASGFPTLWAPKSYSKLHLSSRSAICKSTLKLDVDFGAPSAPTQDVCKFGTTASRPTVV